MRYLLVSTARHQMATRAFPGLRYPTLVRHVPDSRKGLKGVEAGLENALASIGPLPWLIAVGPAVALVQHVAARMLSLRVMGAIFVSPADWIDPHLDLPLTETPFAFPVLTFGAAPSSVAAWRAIAAPQEASADPLNSATFKAMVAARAQALLRTGALGAAPPQTA